LIAGRRPRLCLFCNAQAKTEHAAKRRRELSTFANHYALDWNTGFAPLGKNMRYVQTKLLLTSAIISIGLISMASAADLPTRAPAYTPAPAIVAVAYDWSGFYIGVNGGGATSSINWNADGFGNEGSHDASGGTVGGQIGYRWQTPSSWVFGLEAQGNWADFKGSNASLQFPGQTNQTRIDSFGLFTGQIGYAWDRTLFYVNGGAAVTDNKYTAISTLPPFAGIDTANEARWGAAVGAGIEYAFAQNWSLGFEYDHLFMGNRDVNSATGFLIADHITEDVDLFTARLNYKFGGPAYPRY
jgi:outer membrane immunogenic protein